MKIRKRRQLGILLSLLLIISLFPVVPVAAENNGSTNGKWVLVEERQDSVPEDIHEKNTYAYRYLDLEHTITKTSLKGEVSAALISWDGTYDGTVEIFWTQPKAEYAAGEDISMNIKMDIAIKEQSELSKQFKSTSELLGHFSANYDYEDARGIRDGHPTSFCHMENGNESRTGLWAAAYDKEHMECTVYEKMPEPRIGAPNNRVGIHIDADVCYHGYYGYSWIYEWQEEEQKEPTGKWVFKEIKISATPEDIHKKDVDGYTHFDLVYTMGETSFKGDVSVDQHPYSNLHYVYDGTVAFDWSRPKTEYYPGEQATLDINMKVTGTQSEMTQEWFGASNLNGHFSAFLNHIDEKGKVIIGDWMRVMIDGEEHAGGELILYGGIYEKSDNHWHVYSTVPEPLEYSGRAMAIRVTTDVSFKGYYTVDYIYEWESFEQATEQKETSTEKKEDKTKPSKETEPGVVEIESDASDKEGESESDIPWWLIAAATGGASVVGGTVILEGENEKKKKKQQSRFQLRLSKGFGNTLDVGGEPQPVGARIVEIKPNGEEFTRHDLTQSIRIEPVSYLEVSQSYLAESYKTVQVWAPEEEKNVPEEGVIAFHFAMNGVRYTNKVSFKIRAQEILFTQDNLTLLEGYKKPFYLPVLLKGFGGDKKDEPMADPQVKMTLEGQLKGQNAYTVKVEPDESDPEVYYAVIEDTNPQPKDGKKNTAGHLDRYTLTVTAVKGKRTVTGTLEVVRMTMGLSVDIGAILCYRVPYAPEHCRVTKKSETFLYTDEELNIKSQRFMMEETVGSACLYYWHEDSCQVLKIPARGIRIDFEAKNEKDAQLLDRLGLYMDVYESDSTRKSETHAIVFRCSKGELYAPTRLRVKMKASLKVGEEEYIFEKNVTLRSQPFREKGVTDWCSTRPEEDKRTTENLRRIQDRINERGYYNNIFPLYKMIDLMISGYDEKYGYSRKQIATVRRIWEGFLNGSIVGANAEAEVKAPDFADEVRMAVESIFVGAKQMSDSMGICGKIALGVAVFAAPIIAPGVGLAVSTAATCMSVIDEMGLAYDIKNAIDDYAQKGGENVLEGMWAGLKVYAQDRITGAVVGGSVKLIAKGSKAGAKAIFNSLSEADQALVRSKLKTIQSRLNVDADWNVKTDTSGKTGAGTGKVDTSGKTSAKTEIEGGKTDTAARASAGDDFDLPAEGRKAKEIISKDTNAKTAAKKRASQVECENLDMKEKARQDSIMRNGEAMTVEKLENLHAAYEMYKVNPTQANRKMWADTAKAVQSDKNAMFVLKNKAGADADFKRKALNEMMQTTYELAEEDMKAILSAKTGIPKDKITITHASGNNVADIKNGKAVPMDNDFTVSYEKNGDHYLFDQSLTEPTYNECFYKRYNGFEAPNAKHADAFSGKMDQTNINNPDVHPESFGSDVDILIGKNYEVDLKNPKQVGAAATYKVEHWFERAKQKELRLKDPDLSAAERELIQYDAWGDRMEGYRQGLKSYDNFGDPRNSAHQMKGAKNQIPDKYREACELVRNHLNGKPKMSMAEFENKLQVIGYTPEGFAKATGDILCNIG